MMGLNTLWRRHSGALNRKGEVIEVDMEVGLFGDQELWKMNLI